MLAKGKAPKVRTAAARQEPVCDIPEGRRRKARYKARKGGKEKKWYLFWTDTARR